MHSIPPPLLPWSTRAPIAMIVELGQPPEVLSPPLGPSSEHGLAFLPSGKALLVVAALTVYCRRLSSTLLGKKDLVSPCTRHPGHEYPSRGGRTGIGSSSPVGSRVVDAGPTPVQTREHVRKQFHCREARCTGPRETWREGQVASSWAEPPSTGQAGAGHTYSPCTSRHPEQPAMPPTFLYQAIPPLA